MLAICLKFIATNPHTKNIGKEEEEEEEERATR